GQIKMEGEPQAATPAPIAESELQATVQGTANETPAAIPDEPTRVEDLPQDAALDLAAVQLANEQPTSDDGPDETALSEIAAQEPPANATQTKADDAETAEQPPVETHASLEGTVAAVAPSSSEAREETHAKPSAHSSLSRPPKPRRAKGTFFGLKRVPEPEIMDDSGEVEAYASAAAQAHLDAIDDTFVAHAQLLLKGRERGRVLDIGTGPGQIVIKLGYRLTRWKFVGIDRSAAMIDKALESLATAGELAGRVVFRVADGNALDFHDESFEMVVCNSVLHHIPDPQKLFSEVARVVKPGGAILLRDLRRPSRPGYAFHVWKHGKHYKGEMRQLFIASVQAAHTEEELQRMLAASPLHDVRVFRHGKTHIGFERPIAIPAASKR
ncbi:MAG TPA: methyltransferase domain-containing protein, partial [Candidatus Acidoferrales bacterium]|nr:methyltransferase domain-containing protein [Candidatus Acidoferrales bacterium]